MTLSTGSLTMFTYIGMSRSNLQRIIVKISKSVVVNSLCKVDEADMFNVGRGWTEETDELRQPFLLAVGQLYRLHLLCSVFVIMEIILDRQGFQKLHRGLRPDFWNSVEKQQFFFSLSCVVKLLSIQLKRMMSFKI